MVLVGLALLITLGVLFTGLFSMAKGGSFNARHGNRLMRARVIAQALALALLAIAMLVGKG